MTTATMEERGAETRRFVSLAHAAARAGLSTSTLRKWLRDGRLKAYQPAGCKIVIDVQQLDELILGSAKE